MTDSNNNSTAPDFANFFNDILKNWLFFAISVFIALAIAFVYLKYAAKTYKVSSTVLLDLKENRSNQTKNTEIIALESLMSENKSFQNELFYLKSSPLIHEVVENMDLTVSYYLQENNIPKEVKFTLNDIYTSSPFIVILDKQHIQPINVLIYVSVVDDNEYIISCQESEVELLDMSAHSIVTKNATIHLNGRFKFGEEIKSDQYSFKILLNSNYKSELYAGKDLFFKINNIYQIIGNIRNSLSVKQANLESTLITLDLTTENAKKGVEFLDNLISLYIDKGLSKKNFLASQTLDYIDSQLSNISDSLGNTERQLQFLRTNSSVMNIDEKAGNIYSQLQTLTNKKNEIERKMNYLVQMDGYFSNNKDSTKILAPSSLGLEDPLLNSLIQELTKLNAEKSDIISKNQLKNPRLQTLNVSIVNLKDVISEHIRFNIVATEGELNETLDRINELNKEFSKLPGTQRQLLGIERKFNLNDEIYTSLLEKRIQAQILKSSNLPDCEVVEPPQFVSITSPNSFIILFLSLLLGISVPLMFILGRRLITGKIYELNELMNLTKFNLLGTIPKNPNDINNVVAGLPTHFFAESFQTARSSLVYYLQGKKHSVILVTSTLPGEGKSLAALNLATSFALNNFKTIILELDLRRPSMIFDELSDNSKAGVSSYFIKSSTIDQIITKTEIENLDIIRSGDIPPNPLTFISSEKTTELINNLKEKYDYVLIDTPPYGVVADSSILMPFSDLIVYVTRLGYLTKKSFSSAMFSLNTKSIGNVFILANDVNAERNSYQTYEYNSDYKKKKRGLRFGWKKKT
jgi:tyrosine-protein kinase Etk/Wzc